MKRIFCSSDIGAVLVGNKDWSFAIPNRGGDGETEVLIFDGNDEAEFCKKYEDTQFLSSIQGTFNIYNHDCAFNSGCNDEDVVETLSGRYGVFVGEYKVAFVKWK